MRQRFGWDRKRRYDAGYNVRLGWDILRRNPSSSYEPETLAYYAAHPELTPAEVAALDANIKLIKYSTGVTIASIIANLSMVAGTAFVTNPTFTATGLPSNDLSWMDGTGWKLTLTAGGKTAVSYSKSKGTGETLGSDVLSGWDFTSGWTPAGSPYDITIVDADDLNVTSNYQYMTSDTNKYTLGVLYKSTIAVTGLPLGLQEGGSATVMAASGGGATYRTARQTNKALIQPTATGTGAAKVTTLESLPVLTPTVAGLRVTSTAGGATYNWASNDGINPTTVATTGAQLTITKE